MAREEQPDCVILDIMMPGLDGFEVCRALRDDPATSEISIVMLTAKATTAAKVEGFSAGADDFVTKPFDPVELQLRVSHTMQRRRAMREVSPLTGLPGHIATARELDRRIRTDPRPFGLIHADLDNLTAFSIRHGFVRGDDAITLTADALKECADRAASGFLGHIGGDDFVVICEPAEVEPLCRCIVRGFDHRMDEFARGLGPSDRRGANLTLSLGAVRSTTRHFESHTEATAVAEEMKALAKRTPGTNYEIDRRGRIL